MDFISILHRNLWLRYKKRLKNDFYALDAKFYKNKKIIPPSRPYFLYRTDDE